MPSPPLDFAFEAPKTFDTPAQYDMGPYYSSASSFSSTGSSSFSSTDALPAISRDFCRPSPVETRRPATSHGAMFAFQRGDDPRLFNDPFTSPMKEDKMQQQDISVDPRYIPTNRMQQPSWTMPPPSSIPSAPPVANFDFRTTNTNNMSTRPQTSDGLPKFASATSLPSARTIVNQVEQPYFGLAPPAKITTMPFRDGRSASLSELERPMSLNSRPVYAPNTDPSELTFVPLGGPAPKKRPRRRYDEIERLYQCGWNGCEKAYGTLNHLNAHVAMQKHGEKRLPAEFKDMRKAWRKKKREVAAANANAHYMNAWKSSTGDGARRDSNSSQTSASDAYASTSYSWESRPTTASSAASSDAFAPFNGYAQPMPMDNSSTSASRRGSAPQHIPMPEQQMMQGFRINDGDHPTPTPQNPFPMIPGQQRGAFPFQALTQPMPMQIQANQMYPQFAFQR